MKDELCTGQSAYCFVELLVLAEISYIFKSAVKQKWQASKIYLAIGAALLFVNFNWTEILIICILSYGKWKKRDSIATKRVKSKGNLTISNLTLPMSNFALPYLTYIKLF